jgi:hypothetical protein
MRKHSAGCAKKRQFYVANAVRAQAYRRQPLETANAIQA